MGLKTPAEYKESLRDGREVYINGERIDDVTTHPMLKVAMETERLMLCPKKEGQSVMLLQPGKRTMVPKGTYRVLAYQALRNDAQGDLWKLIASGTKNTPFVTVSARATRRSCSANRINQWLPSRSAHAKASAGARGKRRWR